MNVLNLGSKVILTIRSIPTIVLYVLSVAVNTMLDKVIELLVVASTLVTNVHPALLGLKVQNQKPQKQATNTHYAKGENMSENYYDSMQVIIEFEHQMHEAGYINPPMFSEMQSLEHYTTTKEIKDNVAYINIPTH